MELVIYININRFDLFIVSASVIDIIITFALSDVSNSSFSFAP